LPTTVYIGLGSNLAGDLPSPEMQVVSGLQDVNQLDDTIVTAHSSLYRSTPMTFDNSSEQPDYVNAVASILTGLDPDILLYQLHLIEQAHGRVRGSEWAPRTLDLDILLYGDLEQQSDTLTIPHPGLCAREFVVYPMLEIDPELVIPSHGKLSDIAASVSLNGLEKIVEAE